MVIERKEKMSYSKQIGVAVVMQGARAPAREELSYVETVARLVSEKGLEMEKTLMALNTDNGNKFSFLWSSDPRHALYKQKLDEYHHPHRKAAKNKIKDEAARVADEDDYVDLPLPRYDNLALRYPHSITHMEPFRFPYSITLKERGIIQLTAQFVARYDLYFLRGLKERLANEKKQMHAHHFEFLKPTHGRFAFYDGLVFAYCSVLRTRRESLMMNDPCAPAIFDAFFHHLQLEKLEEGDAMAMIDLHAFVSGVDWFAHMEDEDFRAFMPKPWRLSAMMRRCPEMYPPPLGSGSNLTDDEEEPNPYISVYPPRGFRYHAYGFLRKGITLKEFGIIKLTAQFVVRYGAAFRRELIERVVTNPLFEFLNETYGCSRSKVFTLLVDAYSTVLRLSQKLWRSDDRCSKMVFLEFFARCLQLEKLEEGVEIATVDLLALVSGVDCFAHLDAEIYSSIMPRPERLSAIMNRLGSQLHEDLEAEKQDRRAQDDDAEQSGLSSFIRESFKFRFPAKGITLEELGIIMLTAQFAARYEYHFMCDLESRVVMDTRFEFLKVDDRRYHFYTGLARSYSLVLRPFVKLKKGDARTETVLQAFFDLVQSEEGIGLHALVDCFVHVDYEKYTVIMPAPVHVLMDMIPPTLRLPGMRVLPPVRSNGCVGHLDPHAFRDSPPPPPLSPQVHAPGNDVIKVTAQFEARYGLGFRQALRTRVAEKPLFNFLDQADGMFDRYIKFVEAYSRVFVTSKKMPDTVVEVFFCCLERLQQEQKEVSPRCLDRLQQEQDEGFFRCLDMPTIGWYGRLGVVDCFSHIEELMEQYKSFAMPSLGSQVPPRPEVMEQQHKSFVRMPSLGCPFPPKERKDFVVLPSLGSQVPPRAYDQRPEEPEPKRRKFDESALVPKDQFLAQHSSGSSAIRVFVPNVGEVVIRKQLGNPNFQQTIKT